MIKLHARVTKEIEVTEEQAERMVNYLCGCTEHAEIDDIIQMFSEGISSGGYDDGYIPNEWLVTDLQDCGIHELEQYLVDNYCMKEDVDL